MAPGALAKSFGSEEWKILSTNSLPGCPTNGTQWTWVRNGAPPAAQSLIGWAHLFTGRPWDSETRQCYYRYRWYDPHACRWLSLDPIGYAGGLVQYAYCGGNPVNFVDPTGLGTCPPGGAIDDLALEWHHMLPRGVFDNAFFNANPHLKGKLDLDAEEWGWILPAGAHRIDPDNLHSRGWSYAWTDWLKEQGQLGNEITVDSIRRRLREMQQQPDFAPALKSGRKAAMSYADWSRLADGAVLRFKGLNWEKKAVGETVDACGKKRKLYRWVAKIGKKGAKTLTVFMAVGSAVSAYQEEGAKGALLDITNVGLLLDGAELGGELAASEIDQAVRSSGVHHDLTTRLDWSMYE